jgi:hypothetical protein
MRRTSEELWWYSWSYKEANQCLWMLNNKQMIDFVVCRDQGLNQWITSSQKTPFGTLIWQKCTNFHLANWCLPGHVKSSNVAWFHQTSHLNQPTDTSRQAQVVAFLERESILLCSEKCVGWQTSWCRMAEHSHPDSLSIAAWPNRFHSRVSSRDNRFCSRLRAISLDLVDLVLVWHYGYSCRFQTRSPIQRPTNHTQFWALALRTNQLQPRTLGRGRLFHTLGCAKSFDWQPMSYCSTFGPRMLYLAMQRIDAGSWL